MIPTCRAARRHGLHRIAILALAGTAMACHFPEAGPVRPEVRNGWDEVVLDREDLNLAGVTNATQLFDGRIPGVALRTSGRQISISVRLSRGGALLLVDGIPSPANDLIHLNPNDIQTIRVITDPARLVLYGDRRAVNGVVEIATRN